MNRLSVVFMGTPDLACASLEALLHFPDVTVQGVVTQPDRPKGRDLKLRASPVKEVAERAGILVLQPQRARDAEFTARIRELRPELICVAAFGQILPQELLEIPKFGSLNVHTSLLPKYRGAAPIQWAILNDEPETGVSIMKMDAGLDTGGILSQERTPIASEDNAQSLHDRLARMGAGLLVKTIPGYVSKEIQPRPQSPEEATYAPKIKKEDGHIAWSRPARVIWNQVRGLFPWPGAFTFLPAAPKPLLLKIHIAELSTHTGTPGEILSADKAGIVVACGAQALRITYLQLEGGKRLSAEQFSAGRSCLKGLKLG